MDGVAFPGRGCGRRSRLLCRFVFVVPLVVPLVTAGMLHAQRAADAADAANVAAPVPLAALLAEAKANNPQIVAAGHAVEAARERVPLATTLPAPTFTFQQLSVGSPRPFAGYTNSDFAYAGFGASQMLPYPGKLRLRGQVAERETATREAEVGQTQATVADAVKADYLELAYRDRVLAILGQNKGVLDDLIQTATAHYRVGQGLQQDVLAAQLERTRLLTEITENQQRIGEVEAHLKSLLRRDQQTPDIVPEGLSEHPLRQSAAQLLALARTNDPRLRVEASSVDVANAQLASARREGKPDFTVGYMVQKTDPHFRDMYMFTLDVQLPRRKGVKAGIGEAAARLAESRSTLDAAVQQEFADVKQTYVQAIGDEDLLREYGQGVLPQAQAAYGAARNAYAANRQVLTLVLPQFTEVLKVEVEQARLVAEHETAVAHLETLTGAPLR